MEPLWQEVGCEQKSGSGLSAANKRSLVFRADGLVLRSANALPWEAPPMVSTTLPGYPAPANQGGDLRVRATVSAQIFRQIAALGAACTHLVAKIQRIVLRGDGADLVAQLKLATRGDLDCGAILFVDAEEPIDAGVRRATAKHSDEAEERNGCSNEESAHKLGRADASPA